MTNSETSQIIITNVETSQNSENWPRASRWIEKVSLNCKFKTVVAKNARRCLLSRTQLRAKGTRSRWINAGTFSHNPKNGTNETVTREGNRDTLKLVCMLKARDAPSVTSLMFKRKLENVKTRDPKPQDSTTREQARKRGRSTDDRGKDRSREKDMPRMIQACLEVRGTTTHPRNAVAEAAFFDYATVKNIKNSQQCAEVKILVGARRRWRDVSVSSSSQKSNIRRF